MRHQKGRHLGERSETHHDVSPPDIMMYPHLMRTTLTIDPDVAARLAEVQRETGLSFKEAVNQALRRGLGGTPVGAAEYRMPVRALAVRDGVDIDRIRDHLAELDDQRLQ